MRLDSPHALTLRYQLALLLLALLSLASYVALSYVIVNGRQLVGFIKISDEQQLSSQLVAYYSLLLAQSKSPEERATYRVELNDQIKKLAEQEDLLVLGETTLHRAVEVSPNLESLYFDEPWHLDK